MKTLNKLSIALIVFFVVSIILIVLDIISYIRAQREALESNVARGDNYDKCVNPFGESIGWFNSLYWFFTRVIGT